MTLLPAVEYESGGWVGVHETATPSKRPPDYLRFSVNMMPDPVFGGSWCSRPGFGDPHGISGKLYGRGIQQITQTDGNELTAFFMDATLNVSVNGAAASLVALGGGVAIAANAPSAPSKFVIGTTAFLNYLVAHDTTHVPWVYDGSAFTQLSAAPIAFGKPTVYYGKLFFINRDNRVELQWSNEGDPTTGYDSATPTQAWELRQTSSEPLTAIHGTNEALFYWRPTSFDMIRGEVSDDFSTSGTVAGISTSVGTLSPHAIVQIRDALWFVDQMGRPWRYRIGGGLEPVWQAASRVLEYVDGANLERASAAHDSANGLVVFLIPCEVNSPGSGIANMALVFDEETGSYLGFWHDQEGLVYDYTALDAHVVGTVKRDNTWRLAHLSDRTYVWHLPNDASEIASLGYQQNKFGHSPTAISSLLVTGPMGESSEPKTFLQIRLSFAGGNSLTDVSTKWRASEGDENAYQTFDVAGINEVGSGTLSIPHAEQRKVVGTMRRTRWMQIVVAHATAGEVMSLGSVRLWGRVHPASPYGR